MNDKLHAEPLMRHFAFDHLPPDLAAVSRWFHRLAATMTVNLMPSEQRTVALRKLLEAKDAGVRAALEERPAAIEPRHEYPSDYGPGVNWATDAAWEILDTIKPGLLSTEVRAFLAGQIAGHLARREREGRGHGAL